MTTSTDRFERALDRLAGVGGRSHIIAQWDFAAVLTLDAETHLGGTPTDADPYARVDQVLDRDPDSGQPRLRFTTLTGLLRHHLDDRTDGYRTDPPPGGLSDEVFGTTAHASNLTGLPVLWTPGKYVPAHLTRTHNTLDPATRAVAQGQLWSTEVLTVGNKGILSFSLTVRQETEERLLRGLLAALDGLRIDDCDRLRVGARTHVGQGLCHADHWVAIRYGLTTLTDLLDVRGPTWAEHTHSVTQATATSPHTTARAAVNAQRDLLGDGPITEIPDQRAVDTLDLTIAIGVARDSEENGRPVVTLPGLLRVGDIPPPDQEDVEIAHRSTPVPSQTGGVTWAPVLGVAGLHALLRASATHITRALSADRTIADQFVTGVFGDRPEQHAPRPGRLRHTEAYLTDGGWIRRARVAIDPVFGDSMPHLLFDELVYAGGAATVRIHLRQPDEPTRGLLYLIVRDMHEWGYLQLGGGGHGHVVAQSAILTDTGQTTCDVLTADPTHAQPWIDALREILAGVS